MLDLLAGVEDFAAASVCVAPLEAIGYRYRHEYGIPRRHYFVRGDPRTLHLHMVERDSEQWRSTVAFRDLLDCDTEAARVYAQAKRALAALHSCDKGAYRKEKSEVVERLLALSRRR